MKQTTKDYLAKSVGVNVGLGLALGLEKLLNMESSGMGSAITNATYLSAVASTLPTGYLLGKGVTEYAVSKLPTTPEKA